MKNFINHLDRGCIDRLRSIIGKKIQEGYLDISAEFSFHQQTIDTRSIALRISDEKEFLVLKSDWVGDTDELAFDCHKFESSFEINPKFMTIEEFKRLDKAIDGIRCYSSVEFFEKFYSISKIEIYSEIKEAGDEKVEFDSGIVFYFKDKMPIVIVTPDSIKGGLLIYHSFDVIEKLKCNSVLRLTIN